MADRVTLDVDGAIGRITLSHPERRNALTWRMYGELIEACARINATPAVRVVVVRGAGGQAFAAGTDINQFREFRGGRDGVAYEHRTAEVLAAVCGLRVPVLAAVEGVAVGAGLALVLCSDIAVATADSVFGAPIARTLGNCLPPVVMSRLYAAIGRARALRLLMTAELLDARQALEYGLVADVADRSNFESTVDGLAGRIAAGAPLSLAAFKEIDRLLCTAGVDADHIYERVYGSRDFREGVTAFLQKRPPSWEGH